MGDIKKIQINTALFQIGGKKTRKVREKKENIIISTNTLRAKLLKRVSEHKKHEKNGKEKEKKETANDKSQCNEIDKSIDYLNNLKPIIIPIQEKKIQIKIIETPPINSDFMDSVNYLNTLQNNNIPQVKLDDFPTELRDCSLQYNVDIDVPYGILKNGKKPTYRNWKHTRKVFEDEPIMQCKTDTFPIIQSEPINLEIDVPMVQQNVAGIKKTIKTMRVQHKLGKLNNIISVLIKNNATRKIIDNAQTEIKKTTISDITSYLQKHGLLKIGSDAPNDVIRQTFECAMLSGEITNNNNEILLKNFMNEI